jgi:hypothetical protein
LDESIEYPVQGLNSGRRQIEMQAENHAHHHGARARTGAAFSLLRVSAAQRFAIVLIALAALWVGVHWALT